MIIGLKAWIILTIFSGGGLEIVDSIIDHNTKGWKIPLLREMFDTEIVKRVLSIPLELAKEVAMAIINYKVRDGYWFAKGEQISNPSFKASTSFSISKETSNAVWRTNLPAKIKSFVWRLMHNASLTKDNLVKCTSSMDSECPICSHPTENT